jgi:endonuclease YncB( thermonuclease family)
MNHILSVFSNYDINTPGISLDNISTHARVVNIIDGDTLVCIIPYSNNFYKFRVRLHGIDTCEINSKNVFILKKAIQAKEYVFTYLTNYSSVEEEVTNKTFIKNYLNNNVILIWIKCKHFDKFGRLLADVYNLNNLNESLSELLINNKLGYSYCGRTKLNDEEIIKKLSD